MNKTLKKSLKFLGILILIIIIGCIGIWWYFNSTFLDFEDGYEEKTDITEITIDGYSFLDRNGNNKLDIYEDSRRSINERIDDVLGRMTLDEKIHLLKGSGLASAMGKGDSKVAGAVGTIVPTPRLGLPTIYLSDGPAGLRIEPKREGEDRSYYCTAFPIGTLLSSTWNTDLVYDVGTAMGTEAKEYGIDVILGPGANIHRHPLCGRNFEYYSEDPVLTGYIGAAMVNGIESQGIGTSVKHFVANNQETNRNFNDVIVSDRAMREIYLKGFEIIIKESQPSTIMSSYNKVNGVYTSESKALLTDVLREEWNFKGLVMSDWFGGNDAAAMIAAGNDLLEPGTNLQWKALKSAYEDQTLTETQIDIAVKRILRLIMKSNKMQNYQYSNNPDLNAHAKITRQSAAEGMVLLKNENALPINQVQNIALLGLYSYDFIAGGTGSGDVNEAYTISLEDGLKNAGFEINKSAKDIYESHKVKNKEAFKKPEGINAMFSPFNPPNISYSEDMLKTIVSTANLGIITIGRNSGEGGDRVETDDFLISDIEQDMIKKTCEAFHAQNKKVIVVLNVGGVIETASWKAQPDAILLAWQGGQEGGNSVVDILKGKINPSGKLPMTFPVNLNDHASNANFPLDGDPINMMDLFSGDKEKPTEEKIKNKDFTNYEEDIYVGYRHFEKSNTKVSYPFGYGMSYTEFQYNDVIVNHENDTLTIELTVKNVGEKPGKEVIQLYSSKTNTSIDRPIKELKRFKKTNLLNPEESTTIIFNVPITELSYWSEKDSNWVLEKGDYEILIGSSSKDIRFTSMINTN